MPILTGLVDPAPDAPGFLMPVFKMDRYSNVMFAQDIDVNDMVKRFFEFNPPGSMSRYQGKDIFLKVGDPAIWVFKDSDGKIYTGDANFIESTADDLITRGDLKKWPLIQLELERFRNPSEINPEILRAAFIDVFKNSGDLAASVWRDTEIFAPAFRRDVSNNLLVEASFIKLDSVIVIYSDGLSVVVDAGIKEACENTYFGETEYLLRAFGLKTNITIRPFGPMGQRNDHDVKWSIRGIGGVARFVLTKSPFRGTAYDFGGDVSESGIAASGVFINKSTDVRPLSHFIAVCQSTFKHISVMGDQVEAFASSDFIRHLVNIRPFNFGGLPQRRIALFEIPSASVGFDHVWVIGGHRQKQTGNYRNQLSITNAASRLVKSLLTSIIANHEIISQISDDLTRIPSINVFGSVRISKDIPAQDLYRKLLHAMLDEEVLLHSAKRIIFLSPMELRSRTEKISLGERSYLIEVFPASSAYRVQNVSGWAISVTHSENSDQRFLDFCVSLFSGYVPTHSVRGDNALNVTVEGGDFVVRTAHDTQSLMDIIARPSDADGGASIIIARENCTKKTVALARSLGWNLMHYSEIPNWLKLSSASQI